MAHLSRDKLLSASHPSSSSVPISASYALRCESTLAYLKYRAGYLVHIVSASKELLHFVSSFKDTFLTYQAEVRRYYPLRCDLTLTCTQILSIIEVTP